MKPAKNKILFLILFSIPFYKIQGQSNSYYDRMDHVFSNIQPEKVTTGLLKEFGIRFNEVEAYDGTLSVTNWVDKAQWQSLYNSLYTMRVGTATIMTNPSLVFEHLESVQDAQANTILFTVLYYDYQEYKPDAYSNGDVTVSNDQIFDVSGRDPYVTRKIFGATPMRDHFKGNSFDFKLQSNTIYTNNSQTLNSIHVDFDNGQGFQTISLNAVRNV